MDYDQSNNALLLPSPYPKLLQLPQLLHLLHRLHFDGRIALRRGRQELKRLLAWAMLRLA